MEKQMQFVRSRSGRSKWRELQCCALLAAALLWPASGHTADLTFVPNPGFVCDTLVVDAQIDASVTDLRGFSFVFEFDPAVVTPVSVTAGPLVTGAACGNFFQWINSATVGDSIWVDGATLGCSVSGPGSIVRMKFALVTHSAVSPLSCRSGVMRDALNQSIPHTCYPGTLVTCPAIGTESVPWTRMKRVYR
jgi:hypothetical protein